MYTLYIIFICTIYIIPNRLITSCYVKNILDDIIRVLTKNIYLICF